MLRHHWFEVPHLANSTSVLAIEDSQRVPLMKVDQRCLLPVGHLKFVLCNENLQAVQATLEASNTQPASRFPSKKNIGVLKFKFKSLEPFAYASSPEVTLVDFHHCEG